MFLSPNWSSRFNDEAERTARKSYILPHRESYCILEIIILDVPHVARIVILQQAQRTVEI